MSYSNHKLLKSRLPGGFRDFLPDEFAQRQWMLDTAVKVYQSFGFKPLQTSSVEYFETLAGGDETSKQIYRVFNQEPDLSVESLALRFDLTVSLARMMAANRNLFTLPFKRYQIGEVWRGERQQRGRFRQFLQFDADIVGTEHPSADAEILLLMYTTMQALGVENFIIKLNNRKILNGLALKLGMNPDEINTFLRILDKLEKIGWEEVKKLLKGDDTGLTDEVQDKLSLSAESINTVEELINLPPDNSERLDEIFHLIQDVEIGREGVGEIEIIFALLDETGVPEDRISLDLSLARGLDYYTGPVFETILTDLPSLGGVMSGGRYDDLVERFSKESLPATGVSLGVDRLLVGLQELGLLKAEQSASDFLIVGLGEEMRGIAFKVAHELRRRNIKTEVFLGDKMGMKQQLKYADKSGIKYAVIIGSDEWAKQTASVKNMKNGEQIEIPISKLEEFYLKIRD
ncbi:histidine--tRNA ligase [bacterium]|nr:histidine--tRNA ligase [bacterium]